MELQNLFLQMPEVHRDVLLYLMDALRRVGIEKESNKMDYFNLATVWGPCILYTSDLSKIMSDAEKVQNVVELMIEHSDSLIERVLGELKSSTDSTASGQFLSLSLNSSRSVNDLITPTKNNLSLNSSKSAHEILTPSKQRDTFKDSSSSSESSNKNRNSNNINSDSD